MCQASGLVAVFCVNQHFTSSLPRQLSQDKGGSPFGAAKNYCACRLSTAQLAECCRRVLFEDMDADRPARQGILECNTVRNSVFIDEYNRRRQRLFSHDGNR